MAIKFTLILWFKRARRWCRFFNIYTDSLLVYENKYYLQVYLENKAYKIVNTQMVDYLINFLIL